ncbi:MAG: hypothetical protein CSA22_09950 [Deltaproteobacteria bacterium]|nr:MAG: hypothetical protein CSA22_09950 [Deltaproteobacteria bacterium]
MESILKGVRRFALAACVGIGLVSIIATGGGGDGDSGDGGGKDRRSALNGVWRLVSLQFYDEEEDTCITETFPAETVTVYGNMVDVYIKVSDAETIQQYYEIFESPRGPSDVYTCPEDAKKVRISGNTITNEDGETFSYTLDGDTLTITDETKAGCQKKEVYEKASESDISGAIIECSN